MECAVGKVWSVELECKVWSVKSGARSVKWKAWSVKCKVWRADCRV